MSGSSDKHIIMYNIQVSSLYSTYIIMYSCSVLVETIKHTLSQVTRQSLSLCVSFMFLCVGCLQCMVYVCGVSAMYGVCVRCLQCMVFVCGVCNVWCSCEVSAMYGVHVWGFSVGI